MQMDVLDTYTDFRGDTHPIIGSSLPTGNPADGGWALIDRHGEGRLELVAWEPEGADYEPVQGRWFHVYEAGEPDDPSDWINAGAVARTVGLSEEELLELINSPDPVERASALDAVASHYGWAELTAGIIDRKSVFQMNAEFGDAFELPVLNIVHEEFDDEYGIRIIANEGDERVTIVEWGQVVGHPDEDAAFQRAEYELGLDDLFPTRCDIEALLLLDSEDKQVTRLEKAFHRMLKDRTTRISPHDVAIVENIGDDE